MNLIKTPHLFIGAIALLFFIVSESSTFWYDLDKAKKDLKQSNRFVIENLTQDQKDSVNILANSLAVDAVVHEGYKKNDPQIIKQHILPVWNKVTKDKLIHEIHFFKPPATSFVNFSNFKSIGRDISDVRTDIEWVTSSFKPSSHAMMCKSYAGYRATYPVIDAKGEILGGISLGKKIDWIPETLKERSGNHAFLVYLRDSTSSLTNQYYTDFIKDKELIGDYILAEQTVKIPSKLITSIDFLRPAQNINLNGKDYFMTSFLIKDFNDAPMAYIFTLNDLQSFYNSFIWRLIKDFIIIVITALLIWYITRRKTQGILKQVSDIEAIAHGIGTRDFTLLKQQPKEIVGTLDQEEVLATLKSDVVDMGLVIEKNYTKLEQELTQKLYVDELTGLPNRNALMKDMEDFKSAPLAILNVRSFKKVNDAFGLNVGNFILGEVGKQLKRFPQKHKSQFYRMGADEFALLIKDAIVSMENVKSFINDIIDAIDKETFYCHNHEVDIPVSLYAGLCFDSQSRLEKADMALMQAKYENLPCSVYSESEDMKKQHENNMAITHKIKHALKNNHIMVYYQPIVDTKARVLKYESLVRMLDVNTVLSPDQFLPISRKTKYYTQITKSVIAQSFERFENRSEAFSINLSADDILNEEIVSFIMDRVEKIKDSSRVVFEIVETENIYSSKKIQAFIAAVKNAGAKIAIDDFGTGYSNFSYLMELEPDYLKIDGSLIRNLHEDNNAKTIVQTIVTFANQLNIKTVAEYVHSSKIFEICIEMGINEFQGFYFSEPKPLD